MGLNSLMNQFCNGHIFRLAKGAMKIAKAIKLNNLWMVRPWACREQDVVLGAAGTTVAGLGQRPGWQHTRRAEHSGGGMPIEHAS